MEGPDAHIRMAIMTVLLNSAWLVPLLCPWSLDCARPLHSSEAVSARTLTIGLEARRVGLTLLQRLHWEQLRGCLPPDLRQQGEISSKRLSIRFTSVAEKLTIEGKALPRAIRLYMFPKIPTVNACTAEEISLRSGSCCGHPRHKERVSAGYSR
jgi:hypothetical protein